MILKQTFQSLMVQTAGLESATHTCSGTCKQKIDIFFFQEKFSQNIYEKKSELKCHIWRHLINSKANCLKVAVKPFLLTSILLHQPQKKGASVLPIQRIIIDVLQTHHELRVGCERG